MIWATAGSTTAASAETFNEFCSLSNFSYSPKSFKLYYTLTFALCLGWHISLEIHVGRGFGWLVGWHELIRVAGWQK